MARRGSSCAFLQYDLHRDTGWRNDGVKFKVLLTAAATKYMGDAVWEILATAYWLQN